jgi:hypothetical protein
MEEMFGEAAVGLILRQRIYLNILYQSKIFLQTMNGYNSKLLLLMMKRVAL